MNLTENDQGFINGLESLLIYRNSHELVDILKEHGGAGFDYIFISAWEDDSEDLTGWHDKYFNGFRIDLVDGASSGGIHTNKYGLSTKADSYYLTENNLERVTAALSESVMLREFLIYAEQKTKEQCSLGLKSEILW